CKGNFCKKDTFRYHFSYFFSFQSSGFVLSEKLTFGKNSPIWGISLQRSENLHTAKAGNLWYFLLTSGMLHNYVIVMID
ncbi:hypothetical protein, partial [Xenorhabdus bovienii]|uniref:hypothetical protein n=1 Tax=Xenorhabdus bovienii TaxID=40576 RepID=UPI0023B291DF